ncbi:MAG: hypothetical protein HY273_05125 [Gammaproteobacteria bacterium]|nr:hypothetical protein [Gammaproteobacteria bacterium]
MRQLFLVCAVFLTTVAAVGCTSIPSNFVGDPGKHGFVIVEGEAAITLQRDGGATTKQNSEFGPNSRFSEIQEVTLESAERPMQTIRGRNQGGLTWFSDLEPGSYRVKDIRLNNERGDASFRLPQGGLSESSLSFRVGAGELSYLGYIEISQHKREIASKLGTFELTNILRFNVVHNRDELRAWEYVYDWYARTPWEPLLLKKIETVQKPGSN